MLLVLVPLWAGCASQVAGNHQMALVIAAGVQGGSTAGGETLMTAAQAECLGDAVVAHLGKSGVVDAGIVDGEGVFVGAPTNTSDEVAHAWVDGLSSCLDVRGYYVGLTRLSVDGVLDRRRDPVWAKAAACVSRNVPATDIEAVLRGLLQGRLVDTASSAALATCVAIAPPAPVTAEPLTSSGSRR